MNNILELKGINKIYGNEIKTQVLYDINLSFEQGSFNSIIGQSGSGKSTLLNIIGTLDQPTSGEIMIGGKNVSSMSKNQLAVLRTDTIGFVFQFHYLLPEFTALENVLMPYEIKHGKISKEIIAKAEEYMELVGLQNVKNNLSTKMSGGQQQRTAIARALINDPKIILADEPTGNLDPDTSSEILALLKKINKRGTAVLVVTHNYEIVKKANERVIKLEDGRALKAIIKPKSEPHL